MHGATRNACRNRKNFEYPLPRDVTRVDVTSCAKTFRLAVLSLFASRIRTELSLDVPVVFHFLLACDNELRHRVSYPSTPCLIFCIDRFLFPLVVGRALLSHRSRWSLTRLARDLLQANRHVGDLFEDLRDGLNLISLLEVLSGEYLVST